MTTSPPYARRRRGRPVLAGLVLGFTGLLALTGCGSSKPVTSGKTPTQVLQLAQKKFDDATSVHLQLSTEATPKEGNGVLSADGDLTSQPAFEGQVKVLLNGLSATVPITSVDGEVHAKLPLQTDYAVINPDEYGAPDPATFKQKGAGLGALLGMLQSLKKAGQTREGGTVLTSYTGTLPGTPVKAIIPSASAKATYTTKVGVDSDGFARTVNVTGPFFTGVDSVTYDVLLDDYGKDVKVTAP